MNPTTLDFAIIIPARYASTRFPGKPLALLGGKPVIQHVYEQAGKVCEKVYVATDDDRIADIVERFGGIAVMTSDDLKSGTDRVRQAMRKLDLDVDVVINIQGDEPFVNPDQIIAIEKCFENYPDTEIATLVKRFDPKESFEKLFDPSVVKVTFNDKMEALYFSRSIIPYVRDKEWKEWLNSAEFHTHIGMYAYTPEILDKIADLPQSNLEIAESLEQLRWLQNGLRIRVGVTDINTIGIDTPQDLALAEEYLKTLG